MVVVAVVVELMNVDRVQGFFECTVARIKNIIFFDEGVELAIWELRFSTRKTVKQEWRKVARLL